MKKKNNKGFTLIELLAVIVVLAILFAVAIPLVTKSINQARTRGVNSTMASVISEAKTQIATDYDPSGDKGVGLAQIIINDLDQWKDSNYLLTTFYDSNSNNYTIKLTAKGKFYNIDFKNNLGKKYYEDNYCYNTASRTITAIMNADGTLQKASGTCDEISN